MLQILVFQADPLELLKKDSDTTLFIASWLNKLGYQIFFYEAQNLTYSRELGPVAKGYFLEVQDLGQELSYEKKSELIELTLSDVRAVFIRQDPPFDLDYLLSTQILSLLPKNVLILNKPELLRDHSEKTLPYFLAIKLNDFSFIPPSIVSSDEGEIINFLQKEKEIILKPLYDFGGDDVVKVIKSKEIIDYLKGKSSPIVAQKFLPQVYQGDKRLLVYDKKILGIIKRIPKKDSYLTNTIKGSKVELLEITDKEKDFFQKIVEALPEGLFFAGLDFIDSYLTEVNITSPGLLYRFKLLAGQEAVKPFFDNLLIKLAE
jgi:glutathione synthase